MNARTLGARLFPHNNRRCVCPPGAIGKGDGKTIIVSSLMRSGTHLLIDLILNNFSAYRKNPLYVDVDQYLKLGRPIDDLLSCGNRVLKTHFPQSRENSGSIDRFAELAESGYVLRPERDLEDVHRSLREFSEAGSYDDLLKEQMESREFWDGFNVLRVPFGDLVDPSRTAYLVSQIARFANIEPRSRLVSNFRRDDTAKVLLAKLSTRVLGKRSPRINTTIQFASTKSGRSVAP